MRLLLVEDEKQLAEALTELLMENKHTVDAGMMVKPDSIMP